MPSLHSGVVRFAPALCLIGGRLHIARGREVTCLQSSRQFCQRHERFARRLRRRQHEEGAKGGSRGQLPRQRLGGELMCIE